MKVLLIGPLPPPITGNSLANQVILKYLPKQHNVKVNAIDTGYNVFKEDIGKFSLKKVFYYTKQYLELYKIFNTDKVYLTIGQTFLGVLKYFPYFLTAKLLKKEIIVHIHGNYLGKEYAKLNGIRKKIFKFIISMADKGIVLSESLCDNLNPFLPENDIFILKNFVEDYLFDEDLKKDFSKLKIIFLSNLMKEKGILDLLDSLLILKDKNIPFEVKVAGGMDKGLKQQILDNFDMLKDNLQYLGIVEGAIKKELLQWGNVFVFPTYYQMEGQPIAIFEAMATGNIILTTAHAGIPDVFTEGYNGFYIDKKSPVSIATKLIELNRNLKQFEQISENNKKEAKDRYRVKIFIDNLYKILKDKRCKT